MPASIKILASNILDLVKRIEWIGPLLVRLTLGLVFVTTGWGKLHSLDTITDYFTQLNIPAPHAQAVMVSTIEFVGGCLLILGLGTRIVSVLLVGVMAVAIYTAKLPELHGVAELAATDECIYLVAFIWLAVAGAGAASLDHLIARRSRA
ncbi:MAG TPA: DoxX family protein [Kofleriaceae bacterium]